MGLDDVIAGEVEITDLLINSMSQLLASDDKSSSLSGSNAIVVKSLVEDITFVVHSR